MRFSIKPSAHEALCTRCRWSTIVETSKGTILTYCAEAGSHTGSTVPSNIIKCNSFSELGTASEHDYEKIAWLIRSDKSGKILGFEKPKKKTDD